MKILYQLVSLIIVCSANLSGQDVIEMQSKTKGLSAGIHVGFISYTDDKIHTETEAGLGYGAQIQYGFSHQFAVALSFQHFAITTQSYPNTDIPYNIDSPYPYTEADLIGKYIFGSTNSKLRPNISLGFNYTKSKETYYNPVFNYTSLETYSGFGFCGGGGLAYFLNTQMSLDLSLIFHSGDFTTTLINGQELDFAHSYFNVEGLVGFNYHF